jgi:acyl carrier protein
METDYENVILAYAVNLHLSAILNRGDLKSNLAFIDKQTCQIVYEIAKHLYNDVGARVSFTSIREFVVNHRNLLEKEILKEEQRIQRELEREKLMAIERVEREKLMAIEKVEREKRYKLKIENRLSEAEVRTEKEDILVKLTSIIVEQLSVEKDRVVLDAHFYQDLRADSLDRVEIIMMLEEEFDIEISDEDAEEIIFVREALEYIYLHT